MKLLVIVAAVLLLWFLLDQAKSSGGAYGSNDDSPDGYPDDEGATDPNAYSPFQQLTQAWAQAEGWNDPSSLAQRNLNPVNIKGNWPGVIGHDSRGFAIFDSEVSGWNAAQSYEQQQAAQHPGWSLQNFFAKVLGSLSGTPVNNDQGNSDQEAHNVASLLGIPITENLADYLGMS